MALTVNADTYNADSFQKDTVIYIGPDKTVTMKDDVKLSRVAPKPTSTFSGVGRTQAKMTRTVALTDALTPTGDLIIEVSVTAPVGCLAATVNTALQDMGTLVKTTDFQDHVNQQKVSF